MRHFFLLVILMVARATITTGNQRDMFHCYLPKQPYSAAGTHQMDLQRRQDIKSNTDLMEKRFREFKEDIRAKIRKEFNSFTYLMQRSYETFVGGLTAKIRIIERLLNEHKRYAVYTHWGKSTCAVGAELIMSGYTGGSWHASTGAATNPLCLPQDPEWDAYKDGIDKWRAYVYGAEYETKTFKGYLTTLNQHDVPCAICLTRNSSAVKMFSARQNCAKGWKMEYRGYLMAGQHDQNSGSEYTCIDERADSIPLGKRNRDGYLFYPVESQCGSLGCPPYVEGRELACVVCSK